MISELFLELFAGAHESHVCPDRTCVQEDPVVDDTCIDGNGMAFDRDARRHFQVERNRKILREMVERPARKNRELDTLSGQRTGCASDRAVASGDEDA